MSSMFGISKRVARTEGIEPSFTVLEAARHPVLARIVGVHGYRLRRELLLVGRGGRIRTCVFLNPNQAGWPNFPTPRRLVRCTNRGAQRAASGGISPKRSDSGAEHVSRVAGMGANRQLAFVLSRGVSSLCGPAGCVRVPGILGRR